MKRAPNLEKTGTFHFFPLLNVHQPGKNWNGLNVHQNDLLHNHLSELHVRTCSNPSGRVAICTVVLKAGEFASLCTSSRDWCNSSDLNCSLERYHCSASASLAYSARGRSKLQRLPPPFECWGCRRECRKADGSRPKPPPLLR